METAALLLGVTFPQLGLAAAKLHIPIVTTFGIFVIQGLQLRRKEAAAALSATGAITYGLVSILLLTPLLGVVAVQLPLSPPSLALGLGVFCAMPTALSSGITFTQQLGASIRGFVPGAAAVIDQHKKLLSYVSAGLLALVPWMQISKTASQKVAVGALGVATTAAAGIAIHAVFLAINSSACRVLRLGGDDPKAARDVQRAVVLVSSVKTLPVAVTVLGKLSPVLGEAAVGLAVVPCVFAHLGQIVWDSLMVSKWKAADELQALSATQAEEQQNPNTAKDL
eukprot:gene5264-5499_t